MARIKKKGTSGSAKNFITRTQAVRKLQISLADFRRLCIFKGIYPREPGNKKKASKSSTPSTTFYYTRDVQYLLHEPLLRKFREHKALAKKISRYLGRGEVSDAARLEKNHKPRLSLDHIIKERYPTFVDALRDLDDALSMVFLFANLPSTSAVPTKTIALCQRLCLEFQHYLIVSHSLRKSFLSIKGIYYQATIQGQDILWLVPYQFVQRMTDDIDFRIMGTFVQFYTTLLGFVNFRLYTSIGLVYPPKFNASSSERGGELRAFTLEGKPIGNQITQNDQAEQVQNGVEPRTNGHTSTGGVKTRPQEDLGLVVQRIAAAEEEEHPEVEHEAAPKEDDTVPDGAIDVFDAPISADADVLPQPAPSADTTASLFAPFTFFLSRETPRAPLEFLLRSFGCNRIGWDVVSGDGAYTNDEHDPSITHQVVDRPALPVDTVAAADTAANGGGAISHARARTRVPGRIYVQPQWVWDCVNAGKLLRPDLYGPGAELPPHLSPWVKPTKGQYDPTIPLAEQEEEGEAAEDVGVDEENANEDAEDEAQNESALNSKPDSNTAMQIELAQSSDDEDDDEHGMDVAVDESSEDSEDKPEDQDPSDEADAWDGMNEDSNKEKQAVEKTAATNRDDENEDDEAEEGDDDDDENVLHQRELEAEAAGLAPPKSTSSTSHAASSTAKSNEKLRAEAKKRRAAQAEELERQRMMMSRKKRKTLDRMLHSDRRKDDEALALRKKRRRIERERETGRESR